jgi:dihydrofolate reductase
MSRLRVHGFSISLDGYGAGPAQDVTNPLGVGGFGLHEWIVQTRTFHQMSGSTAGTTGVDDDFAARGFANLGGWIMGRNMFGPIRGPWPNHDWTGWWGDDPLYHVPVFVLTHHPRPPVTMNGGTTFHFVAGEPADVLARARQVAGGKDVRLGGGVATLRAYLKAGLVDEMHVAIAPVLLGSGEHLWSRLDLPAAGYTCSEHVTTEKATHVVLSRGA